MDIGSLTSTHSSPAAADGITEREQVMLSFFSQMRERLQTSSTLDEFRAWMSENVPDVKRQKRQPRQQIQPTALLSWNEAKETKLGRSKRRALFNSPLSVVLLREGDIKDNNGNDATAADFTIGGTDRGSGGGSIVRIEAPPSSFPGNDSILICTPISERKKLEFSRESATKALFSPMLCEESSMLESPNRDGKTEREVASFLHLSFSWTSNILFRAGLDIFGSGRRRHKFHTPGHGGSSSDFNVDKSISLAPEKHCDLLKSSTKRMIEASSMKKLAADVTSKSSLSTVYYARNDATSPARRVSLFGSGSIGDFTEGMPAFSLEGRLPGQRVLFSRKCTRHSSVFRPMEEVQAALRCVGVPFMPDVDLLDVDVLYYWNMYGHSCYVYTCMNIILRYNFVNRFAFNLQRLYRYYTTALTYIHSRNPFHNACQAADIVLAIHQFLLQPYLAENLSDEELFSIIFAATVMRLGHLGVTNTFLLTVRHPYACNHSYFAPLQSVSLSLAFAIFNTSECCFPTQSGDGSSNNSTPPSAWTRAKETELFEIVSQLVMCTDERNHQGLSSEMQAVLHDGKEAVVRDHHLMIVLRNLMYAMNFSYLFRRLSVCKYAAACAVAEFYRETHAIRYVTTECSSHWPLRSRPTTALERFPSISISSHLVPTKNITTVRVMREKKNKKKMSHIEKTSSHNNDYKHNNKFVDSRKQSVSQANMTLPSLATTVLFTPVEEQATSLKAVSKEAWTSANGGCGRRMQLALLEVLFLPFIEALAPLLPPTWLTYAQCNLKWFQEHGDEAFEDNVTSVLADGSAFDAVLPIHQAAFEEAVLRRIVMAPEEPEIALPSQSRTDIKRHSLSM